MAWSSEAFEDTTDVSGVVYGVRLRGRLPSGFAPFVQPLQGSEADLGLTLEVTYRAVASLPGVEEIWVAEPMPPLSRDRFSLFRQPGGFGLTVASESQGLFRVHSQAIEIEWLPGAIGAPHFFFSYALPLWLECRGVPVLHASAVSLGEQAVAFIAPSGAGKSTLCAGLVRGGWGFVADDGLPLYEDERGDWRCFAGSPWLRLWPSALEGPLGISASDLPRVHETLEKRRLPVLAREITGPCAAGLRVARIYLVERRADGAGPAEISILAPRESLVRLIEHSLGGAPLEVLGLSESRLERLARVAERVQVRRLSYPSGEESWKVVRDAVAADVTAP
jgi:hypothetical protein